MTKRMWEPGRTLSPLEAWAEIERGNPVYFRSKWTHNGWARSWQINMLIGSAKRGFIFEATRIHEEENDRSSN
jgi:hypothetical protein